MLSKPYKIHYVWIKEQTGPVLKNKIWTKHVQLGEMSLRKLARTYLDQKCIHSGENSYILLGITVGNAGNRIEKRSYPK